MARLEQIQEMLAADPDDVFLNFALAMAYVAAEQPDEAVTQFRRVIGLEPDHTATYTQLAAVLIGLGRKDEAKTVLADGLAAAKRTGDTHAAEKMRQTQALIE